MNDMAYVISRMLEDRIAIAENNDQNTLIVTLDVLKTILALLKEQTKIIYCKDCKSYDEQISICDNCGLLREQTFFCKDGKRR